MAAGGQAGSAAGSQPLLGNPGVAWSRTPFGAAQRAWGKALLLFGRPRRIRPDGWASSTGRLPDAEMLVLSGCGHLPHVEDPAAFGRALVQLAAIPP